MCVCVCVRVMARSTEEEANMISALSQTARVPGGGRGGGKAMTTVNPHAVARLHGRV